MHVRLSQDSDSCSFISRISRVLITCAASRVFCPSRLGWFDKLKCRSEEGLGSHTFWLILSALGPTALTAIDHLIADDIVDTMTSFIESHDREHHEEEVSISMPNSPPSNGSVQCPVFYVFS